MLFVGLTLLGYISYKNLLYELYPSVELPVMIVRADSRLDVTPAYVERHALIPIEGAIGTLEGIESIDSYADHRSGTVFITYKDNTNKKYAYLKLEQKIEAIRSTLDEEFVVNVLKVDTKQISNQFMDLEVRGTGGSDRIRNIVDKSILDKLESVDGIASVEVFGGREKTIEIILNEQATEAYSLTPSMISRLISQNNQQRVFVGQVVDNKNKFFVNVTAENSELSHLENIVVNPIGPVRLKDVAEIYFGVKEESSYSRVNGKESVTLRLIRDSQVNLIELSNSIKETIQKLNGRLTSQDIDIVI
jgi:multidrug efflux pump subunit AcrB